MGTELSKVEPILVPDVRQPAKLNSLPEWAKARCDTLKTEIQPDKTGKYRPVPVLPSALIPTPIQRGLILRHAAALADVIAMTPESDYRHAQQTVTVISKMMLVLPSREAGDLAAEAKSEAYMAALEDVPSWAVQEAVRKWYRGECGAEHDYKWQPGPAVLRGAALVEACRVRETHRKLIQILAAEPIIEFDEAHRTRMLSKLLDLKITLHESEAEK